MTVFDYIMLGIAIPWALMIGIGLIVAILHPRITSIEPTVLFPVPFIMLLIEAYRYWG